MPCPPLLRMHLHHHRPFPLYLMARRRWITKRLPPLLLTHRQPPATKAEIDDATVAFATHRLVVTTYTNYSVGASEPEPKPGETMS